MNDQSPSTTNGPQAPDPLGRYRRALVHLEGFEHAAAVETVREIARALRAQVLAGEAIAHHAGGDLAYAALRTAAAQVNADDALVLLMAPDVPLSTTTLPAGMVRVQTVLPYREGE